MQPPRFARAKLFARRLEVGLAREGRRHVAATGAARAWLAHVPSHAEAQIARLAASPRQGWPRLFDRPDPHRFRAQFPAVASAILDAARAARERTPELFGVVVGRAHAGEGLLPWHRDTAGGHAWPIDVPGMRLGPVTGSDIKRPWELSRFQHLLPCALAYWLTGDDEHVEEVWAQVADWLDHNRFGCGVNWASSMEAAMRSITWLYLLDATFDSPVLTRERRADWLRALFQHGRFIDFLPETSARVAGDHFVAGQTGRFALGVVFAGCAEGQRWREEALAALAADSPDQIDDDGVYRGGAIAYGALIAELHRVVLELARRNSIDVPDHFATRADKLAAFILTCTPASGLIPAIGDCDDARVLPLDPTAARRDRGFLGGGDASAEAALWQSPTIAPAIVRDRGAAFRDTGFYVLRTATLTAVVDGFRTFARAPNGQRHESRLAVVVADASGELVCDPGVAGYTADREVEQRFRSAQAHNVLAPRGAAQTIGSRPGRIGHEGHVELCHYSADAAREEVELAFDGYPGLVWWRRVVLDRRRAVVLVEDRIDPTTEQMLEIRWHLPPGEAAVAGGVASIAGRGAVVALDVASEQGCWRVEPGEIALRYGSREPAPVLVREVSASAAARWLTAIVSLRDRTLGDAVTAAREAAA